MLHLTPEAMLVTFYADPTYAEEGQWNRDFWLDWCRAVIDCLRDRFTNVATYREIIEVKLVVLEQVMTREWCFLSHIPSFDAYEGVKEDFEIVGDMIRDSYKCVLERIEFYRASLRDMDHPGVCLNLEYELGLYHDEFPNSTDLNLLQDVYYGHYTVGELIAVCPWMLLV